MSGTPAASSFPPEASEVTKLRRALQMDTNANSSPATQSTAAASNATAMAVVVILIWVLSLFHLDVPAQVSAAFTVLVGGFVHWAVIKFGMTDPIT